jgi:hypothetical protein
MFLQTAALRSAFFWLAVARRIAGLGTEFETPSLGPAMLATFARHVSPLGRNAIDSLQGFCKRHAVTRKNDCARRRRIAPTT